MELSNKPWSSVINQSVDYVFEEIRLNGQARFGNTSTFAGRFSSGQIFYCSGIVLTSGKQFSSTSENY